MRCICTWYVFSSVRFYDYDYVVSHYRQFSWVCNCGHGQYCPFSKCSVRSHRFVRVTCVSVTHSYNKTRYHHSFVTFVRIVYRRRIKMRCECDVDSTAPAPRFRYQPTDYLPRTPNSTCIWRFLQNHFGISWQPNTHNAQALLFIVWLRSHTGRVQVKLSTARHSDHYMAERCIQSETFKSDLYYCTKKLTSFGCKFYGRITINVQFKLLPLRVRVFSFLCHLIFNTVGQIWTGHGHGNVGDVWKMTRDHING